MSKINKVKERLLFLSPTVQAGWEDESTISDFDKLKCLGTYFCGKAYKVLHKRSKLIYTINDMDKKELKSQGLSEQIILEVKLMYSLNHQNIIKLLNHFEDDEKVYLILEFPSGGLLYFNRFKQPGKRFTEKTTAKYIYQLIDALEYIQSKKITYRDFRPNNILIDAEDNIKLTEFGQLYVFKIDQRRNRIDSLEFLNYVTPEMLERRNYRLDILVDVWNVGILTFELLTGFNPFSQDQDQKDFFQIEEEKKNNIICAKYSFAKDFPTMAKDFVSKILVKNSSQRLQIAQMKEHPWIIENVDKKFLKAPPKYEEELKSLKKDVNLVKLSKEELGPALAKTQESFTTDEIYKYSRPDSIVNKEESIITKKIRTEADEEDANNILKLQERIEQLETENRNLKTFYGKDNNFEEFKEINEKLKVLEEEKTQAILKLKNSEEKIEKLKTEFDEFCKHCVEKEKSYQKLQLKMQTEEADNYGKLKQKYKDLNDKFFEKSNEICSLELKLCSALAENDELKKKVADK